MDRDQIISQLKDTIQEVKLLTASEQKYLKKETRAHETTIKQQCQRKTDRLEGDKDQLVHQVEVEQKAHQAIMDFLTLQREELDQQIQDWMTKYEDDTEGKMQELEGLKQQRATDFDRYEDLVNQYEALEKTVEEDRLNREREELARKVQEQRIKAAVKIQRWWCRKRDKLKQTKGKGKKGKGSAGKKKK